MLVERQNCLLTCTPPAVFCRLATAHKQTWRAGFVYGIHTILPAFSSAVPPHISTFIRQSTFWFVRNAILVRTTCSSTCGGCGRLWLPAAAPSHPYRTTPRVTVCYVRHSALLHGTPALLQESSAHAQARANAIFYAFTAISIALPLPRCNISRSACLQRLPDTSRCVSAPSGVTIQTPNAAMPLHCAFYRKTHAATYYIPTCPLTRISACLCTAYAAYVHFFSHTIPRQTTLFAYSPFSAAARGHHIPTTMTLSLLPTYACTSHTYHFVIQLPLPTAYSYAF